METAWPSCLRRGRIRLRATSLVWSPPLKPTPADSSPGASLVAHYNSEGYPPVHTNAYRDRIRILLAAGIWTTFMGREWLDPFSA